MNKKIIVTGGAGYIGSHTVVELFNAGFEPVIVDNFSNADKSVINRINEIIGEKVKLYEGDCCDESFLQNMIEQEGDIDGFIHFAAHKAVGESVEKPLEYYRNNFDSLLVVLQMMVKYSIPHFVFSSSCTVYGQAEVLPVTEQTPVQKQESPYGNTKKVCEEMIVDAVNSGVPLKCVSLRYFNPIGAHSSAKIGELPLGVPQNLVPFITQTATGIREQLTVFGDDYDTPDGTCIRDYIHVVDLAKAHVKSLEYLEAEKSGNFYDVFNVGTGNGNSVLEVIKAFEKASGQSLKYAIGPRRVGDIVKIYGNVDKANELLGWKTELSIEDSLRDAWEWQKGLGKKP